MALNHCFEVRSLILAAALISGLVLVTHATAQQRSFLVDLNTGTVNHVSNIESYAFGINDAGQLVGMFFPEPQGGPHAFITGPDGAGIRAISSLDTLGAQASDASDINNAGQVVGSYDDRDGRHAFITDPDGIGARKLGGLAEGPIVASAINTAGQVVGSSRADMPGIFYHAFITGPNGVGIRDLGTLGGPDYGLFNSHAQDINDLGQVAGYSTIAAHQNEFEHAFITGPDGAGMRDLGTLGGNFSFARAINNEGQVAGSSHLATGEEHAFITGPDGMSMRDLGTLGGDSSYAADINNAGQVVGTSRLATGEEHAFITGPNGEGMIDLNSLVKLSEGVFLTEALAINNNGQVIAAGIVPEPEAYALMLAGLGLIGFMARRKKQKIWDEQGVRF